MPQHYNDRNIGDVISRLLSQGQQGLIQNQQTRRADEATNYGRSRDRLGQSNIDRAFTTGQSNIDRNFLEAAKRNALLNQSTQQGLDRNVTLFGQQDESFGTSQDIQTENLKALQFKNSEAYQNALLRGKENVGKSKARPKTPPDILGKMRKARTGLSDKYNEDYQSYLSEKLAFPPVQPTGIDENAAALSEFNYGLNFLNEDYGFDDPGRAQDSVFQAAIAQGLIDAPQPPQQLPVDPRQAAQITGDPQLYEQAVQIASQASDFAGADPLTQQAMVQQIVNFLQQQQQ